MSDHFVRLSREKLHELVERPLDKLKLCVIYLDGIEFKQTAYAVDRDSRRAALARFLQQASAPDAAEAANEQQRAAA